MGAFFQCNIKCYNDFKGYKKEFSDYNFVNITNTGNNVNTINNANKLSLIFSKTPIKDNKVTYINFKEDISLDNIVNIILFNLYSN